MCDHPCARSLSKHIDTLLLGVIPVVVFIVSLLTMRPELFRTTPTSSRQVFFLKSHRTFSSTLQNTLIRMAMNYNLSVWLPEKGPHFSEKQKNGGENVGPRPASVAERYDMAFNHMVFNYTLVRAYMHPRTSYVTILRHPVPRTVSAFLYFTEVSPWSYLLHVPGKAPVITYFRDPARYEPIDPSKSQTNNRMSFDLGLGGIHFHNKAAIKHFIAFIEDTFDLVLIAEHFEESMVLLKRMMGWTSKDIMYTKTNVFHYEKEYFVGKDEQLGNFERFQMADFMLYRHFVKVLKRKMKAEGNGFRNEVAALKMTLRRLDAFCKQPERKQLKVRKTRWDPAFSVSRKDCLLMNTPEPKMMSLLRHSRGNGTRIGSLQDMTLTTVLSLLFKFREEDRERKSARP